MTGTVSQAIAALHTRLYIGDGGGAGVRASKTIGTVNQQLKITSRVGGTTGNSKTFGIVVDAGSVAYSQVITKNSVLINAATTSGTVTTTVAAAIIALTADETFNKYFIADGSSGNASGLLVAGAAAVLSGGSGGETFTMVGGVINLDGPSDQKNFADATHLDSTDGVMEFVPTTSDSGSVSCPLQFVPSDTQQRDLRDDYLAGTLRNWQIRFNDDDESQLSFSGYISQFGLTSQLNDILKGQLAIKLSGPWVWD